MRGIFPAEPLPSPLLPTSNHPSSTTNHPTFTTMAIHKSDIITAKDALSVSEKNISGERTGATILRATAVYTIKGTEADSDVIHLTDLPPTAAVIPEMSHLAFGYPRGATAVTAFLGDATAPGRFGQASVQTGIESAAFGYTDGAGQPVPLPYEKATRVQATLGGISGRVTGGQLVFGIAYRIKG